MLRRLSEAEDRIVCRVVNNMLLYEEAASGRSK